MPRHLGLIVLVLMGWGWGATMVAADTTTADTTTADSSPAQTSSTTTAVPLPSWTVAEAVAALLADDLVVMPDSPARIDEARVRSLLAEGEEGADDLKVLVMPPGPINSDANRSYLERVSEVEDKLREDWDGELVTVVGLDVGYSILGVSTTGLSSVQRLLATLDPTDQIESAIRHARTGSTGDDEDESVAGPTDPAQVARLTAALQEHPIVVDPGAPAVSDEALTRWREETGHDLRLVVLPPLDPGAQQTVTAADLAVSFPDDHVVLFQGLWFELVGPDQPLLAIARDMTLSSYQSFLTGRDVAPGNVLGPLRNQVVEFTSGAVVGQQAPAQRNPLAWLLVVLPVLALGVVVAFAVRRNRTRAQEQVQVRHDGVADRAEAAALLPDLAAGILALDPLARSAREKELVSLATVRYRAARRLVEQGEDGPGALRAVHQAQDALTEAADLLGVPNVPGTRTPESAR